MIYSMNYRWRVLNDFLLRNKIIDHETCNDQYERINGKTDDMINARVTELVLVVQNFCNTFCRGKLQKLFQKWSLCLYKNPWESLHTTFELLPLFVKWRPRHLLHIEKISTYMYYLFELLLNLHDCKTVNKIS